MSLPPGFTDGLQAESHGIGVNLIPGDPRFQVELQRAPDNGSGGPGTFATIQQLPPLPAASTFVDLLPDDGAFRHYRARHIAPGYGPSANWSPVGRGKPVRLEGGAAAGGLISLYPIVRGKPMAPDGKYALMAAGGSGVQADATVQLDPANGIKEGGIVQLLYRHREEITVYGADTDGEVDVTFAQAYQNAPMVLFKGGQYVSFSQTLGTGAGAKHRMRLQAVNITTSGFKSRAQIVNTGATTAQDDDFPASDVLTAVGQTTIVTLNPGVANDDTYNVQYFVSVTLSAPGADPNITLTLAIDTDDGLGGGFIERATFQYSRASAGTSTWSHETKPIVVTGLGNTDQIRIRAKAFVVHDATGSFIVRGGDNGATDTFHGVTYTTATDTIESAIPAAGDQVAWVAQEVT